MWSARAEVFGCAHGFRRHQLSLSHLVQLWRQGLQALGNNLPDGVVFQAKVAWARTSRDQQFAAKELQMALPDSPQGSA